MKLIFSFWIILTCSSVFAQSKIVKLAQPKIVKLGLFPWEPLISENQPGHGVFSEIIVSAFDRVGYKVESKFYPFARLIQMLESGEIDVAPGVSKNEERLKIFDYSSMLYDVNMGFTFKNSKVKYNSIADIKNLKGGIMRRTFWAKELDGLGIKYEEVTDHDPNIQKLITDRIDFVCMPKEVAFNYLKLKGEDLSKYGFGLHRKEGQPMAISKKSKLTGLLNAFEKGLSAIKADGTYDKIIAKSIR